MLTKTTKELMKNNKNRKKELQQFLTWKSVSSKMQGVLLHANIIH